MRLHLEYSVYISDGLQSSKMTTTVTAVIYPYYWLYEHAWQTGEESDRVSCYAVDKNGDSVNVKMDFTPYFYVTVPQSGDGKILDGFTASFKSLTAGRINWSNIVYVYRRILYGNEIDTVTGTPKTKLMLKIFVKSHSKIKYAVKFLTENGPKYLPGLGINWTFTVYEQDINPITKFFATTKVNTCGWVRLCNSRRLVAKNCVTEGCAEFTGGTFENVVEDYTVPPLTCCSFDIECVSESGKFPNAKMPNDSVFQICCILFRLDSPAETESHLLTLGRGGVDPGGGTITTEYSNESDLLCGFSKFLVQHRVNICTGYNIFVFDIPFMIDRSEVLQCRAKFATMGFLKNVACREREISWTSAAYNSQRYKFIDADGRLFVDLLPVVVKTYKLENYALNTVAREFIGDSKSDVSVEDLFYSFKLYKNNHPDGDAAMSMCGAYCVQDGLLVARLFEKLDVWTTHAAMAETCRTDVMSLLIYGQQKRIFSCIYQYCTDNRIVVVKPDHPCNGENYVGAHVFEPVPGVYDLVVPFDFASLYPTTMIALNACYFTLVTDGDDGIDDSLCNVVEWEDHDGCPHDKVTKNRPICARRRFRFLKNCVGVLPAIASEFIEKRRQVRRRMKDCAADAYKIMDKQQLAYKVTANSIYGITGVGTNGVLPLTAVAMCITRTGRENIMRVAKILNDDYGASVVYGDTDSNYVTFPVKMAVSELYSYAERVASEISLKFPRPMQLEFEQSVYLFLVMMKKKYVYRKYLRDGTLDRSNIGKRGVCLVRRDTFPLLKNTYERVVSMTLDRCEFGEIMNFIVSVFNELYTRPDYEQLVMSQSFREVNEYKRGTLAPQVDCEERREIVSKIPAVGQLVDRMKRSGEFDQEGDRVNFVYVQNLLPTAKTAAKIQSVKYFLKYRDQLHLNTDYYAERLVQPLDQILECAYGVRAAVTNHVKFRLTVRRKVLQHVKRLAAPKFLVR